MTWRKAISIIASLLIAGAGSIQPSFAGSRIKDIV